MIARFYYDIDRLALPMGTNKSPGLLLGFVVRLVFELIFDEEVNWVVVIGGPIGAAILLVALDRDWIRRD